MKRRHSTRAQRVEVFDATADVYAAELPDLVSRDNKFGWARCPFHDDSNPSFCVNLETGWYRCFSSNCGETGSNIVGFVSLLLGLDFEEARRYIEDEYA